MVLEQDSRVSATRRMERHRRNGAFNVVDDAAANIRSYVERAHDGNGVMRAMDKRQGLGDLFGLGDDDDKDSGADTGSGRSKSGDAASSSLDSSSDSGTGNGRPGGFSFANGESSTTSSMTRSISTTSPSPSSTSATPTSTSSLTHTTPTSTSSSSSSTTDRKPTSTSSYVKPSASSTSVSVASQGPTQTSVAFVTSTPTNNAAASSTPKSEDDGPGAGLIIGIVAGALAGVAVVAAVVGFLVKKYKNNKQDPFESDPFDRAEFRRESAMLPDTGFDSDDGHMTMSEHHNMPASFDPSMGPEVGGIASAGAGMGVATGATGLAAASSFTSHNDSGGPRPPTMFERHMNGPAANYGSEAPSAPQVGAIYAPATSSTTPQLPPMAFGGSDPYSIAGVGRTYNDSNVANPYAHLDRQQSFNGNGEHQSWGPEQQMSPVDRMDRHGSYASQGSWNAQRQQNPREIAQESSAHGYDTAGRPGTAEGRSGTPDIPNMQQTYAVGDGNEDALERSGSGSSSGRYGSSEPEYASPTVHNSTGDPFSSPHESPVQQPLQVRNLLPNPHQAMGQQRPISSASSQPVDDEAANGGVW